MEGPGDDDGAGDLFGIGAEEAPEEDDGAEDPGDQPPCGLDGPEALRSVCPRTRGMMQFSSSLAQWGWQLAAGMEPDVPRAGPAASQPATAAVAAAGAEDLFGIGACAPDGADSAPSLDADMLMDLGLETSCPVVGAPSRASNLEQDLCLESSMPVARASSRRVDGVSCLGNLLQEFGLESGSSACVAQAPPVREPMPQRIPAGIEHLSRAFQVLASQAAARARVERAQERKQMASYDGLADAWDQMVVRHGDLAQRDGTASGRQWVHRNTYTTRGVLQLGFK